MGEEDGINSTFRGGTHINLIVFSFFMSKAKLKTKSM